MRKSVLAVLLAIVGGLIIIGLVMANRPSVNTPSTTSEQTSPPASQQDANENNANEQQVAPTPSPASSNAASVEISNFAFTPASLTVKKGTTVTWTNRDSDQHTVTPDEETADFQGSGMLSRGETYSYTFANAGTYSYHCQPHPQMRGTITVTD